MSDFFREKRKNKSEESEKEKGGHFNVFHKKSLLCLQEFQG